MLVVDLHCTQGHQFEGWFASADDLASQQARGLLGCPVCGSREIVRRPSAPHLNVAGLRDQSPAFARPVAQAVEQSGMSGERDMAAGVASQADAQHVNAAEVSSLMRELQARYISAVRHVMANTEDVGDRFADEARSMHYGDAPERAIRGQTTTDERAALQDEGIEVVSLPVPDVLKGPVQ